MDDRIDALAEQLARLADATEANTTAHQRSSEAIAAMRSEFTTWKESRCDDHQQRLDKQGEQLVAVRLQVNGAIAKAAGAVGAVTFIATIVAAKLVHLFGG